MVNKQYMFSKTLWAMDCVISNVSSLILFVHNNAINKQAWYNQKIHMAHQSISHSTSKAFIFHIKIYHHIMLKLRFSVAQASPDVGHLCAIFMFVCPWDVFRGETFYQCTSATPFCECYDLGLCSVKLVNLRIMVQVIISVVSITFVMDYMQNG